MKKWLRSFLVSLLTGALLGTLVIYLNRDMGYGTLRQLCDGCFVAAVLLLCVGLLRTVINLGAFDVMGYGIQSVFHLHVPGASIGNARDQESMQDYRDRKAKKRKSPKGLLLAGLVWLAASVILLLLYEAAA